MEILERHAGAAPALSTWKDDVLAVTPMAHVKYEMVAEPGIAPESADLQSAALTDSAIQRGKESGPSARYCAAVFRLSGGCSAIELQRESKMVA